MIDMTVKQQVWDEITMKKMYSERQEEPQGVRGGGKCWMRKGREFEKKKKNLEEMSGSKAARTVRARQGCWQGKSIPVHSGVRDMIKAAVLAEEGRSG